VSNSKFAQINMILKIAICS